jgi:soluble cytochrome b562
MMNLDALRDKLDMALDKETADSLNEWLNNKRDVTDEQIAIMQLVGVLDDIQSMMHELTLDERNELIDELTHLYERYNVYAQSRNGDQH